MATCGGDENGAEGCLLLPPSHPRALCYRRLPREAPHLWDEGTVYVRYTVVNSFALAASRSAAKGRTRDDDP